MSWLCTNCRWFIWPILCAGCIAGTVYLAGYVRPPWSSGAPGSYAQTSGAQSSASTEGEEPSQPLQPINVKVIHPTRGTIERVTVQVGSIQAYVTVKLHAKASGFLKTQNVDIGDKVKHGDILAVVDVPEIEKQVERNSAMVEQAKARVVQMKTKIAIAKSDLESAKAKEVESLANAKSATAWVTFRKSYYERMKKLLAETSIAEKVVDEAKEKYEASVESENAAQASIISAKALIVSMAAKIDGAIADVTVAESEVKVTEAELAKAKVQLGFATIPAPFDGVITDRSLYEGDYVRSPSEGGAGALPLLTIQRTDRMKVIVQIPDREVPYADPGDPAFVEIDALPGEKIPAKVSRISYSEDPHTRLMHVEIDVPNPKGAMRQGMYGRVTIILDKSSDQLSIPSGCLTGKAELGKGTVYVVRDGHAHRAAVRLGIDNGLRVEILQGLTAADDVIYQPSNALSEDAEVTTTPLEDAATKSAAADR